MVNSGSNGVMSGWRLNKDVSVADVLSVGLVGLAIITGYLRLDGRITAMEKAMPDQVAADIAVLKSQNADMKNTLARIEEKIDHKADKQ